MKTVLITGANRGIGLALVKACLAEKQLTILATAREPGTASELMQLSQRHEKLHVSQLDLNQTEHIHAWLNEHRPKKLNYLINNAGVYVKPELSEQAMDSDLFLKAFRVNTLGPLALIAGLKTPLMSTNDPCVMTISSQMGSIGRCSGGVNSLSYRMSKAALNMGVTTLAKDLTYMPIHFLTVHPGWVRTDMGGMAADLSPEVSAKSLLHLLMYAKQWESGSFIDYQGQTIPF